MTTAETTEERHVDLVVAAHLKRAEIMVRTGRAPAAQLYLQRLQIETAGRADMERDGHRFRKDEIEALLREDAKIYADAADALGELDLSFKSIAKGLDPEIFRHVVEYNDVDHHLIASYVRSRGHGRPSRVAYVRASIEAQQGSRKGIFWVAINIDPADGAAAQLNIGEGVTSRSEAGQLLRTWIAMGEAALDAEEEIRRAG